ncbi:hypothetical protein PPACK8108_LOCUS14155 [Phakopsora pachyrhizi]|uniref:Uncharacterized protein n=1 Tax=Phakopsora pachyrhizi TaxID=170000 RepID=A0AAV0B623_PHAPC|nr:hypothetical protein PPACK8108_LOCUS14155 [Phakopsora pachyrhizi]
MVGRQTEEAVYTGDQGNPESGPFDNDLMKLARGRLVNWWMVGEWWCAWTVGWGQWADGRTGSLRPRPENDAVVMRLDQWAVAPEEELSSRGGCWRERRVGDEIPTTATTSMRQKYRIVGGMKTCQIDFRKRGDLEIINF